MLKKAKFDYNNILIVLSLVIALYVIFNIKNYKQADKVISWDVTNYYSYLPATFIYGDVLLNFTKEQPEKWYDKFVPLTTPTGGKVIKMSMGLSYCYAPFFAIAHVIAKITPYQDGGYSLPYRLALMLSSVCFFALGLIYLKKILIRLYSKQVVFITLLVIGLGTNLFYYTAIRSAMSHSYNFALITLFVWLSIQWHNKPKIVNSTLIGLLIGLIVLIRPTNILVVIIFLLYRVSSLNDLKDKLKLFLSKYYLILIILLAFVLVWIPQLLYWKAVSGQYFYFSYQGERFFFGNPQILKGLFSYRNGWLIYTPLMSMALVGLFFIYKNQKAFFWPIMIYSILSIYVITSWWCWWYVGYGNRAFIDLYGVMAIPFAAFMSWIFEKKQWLRTVTISIILLFVSLNLFQTYQYYKGYIQFDSMSKAAYWDVFLKADPKNSYWGLLEKPDYKKALEGIYENHPPKDQSE